MPLHHNGHDPAEMGRSDGTAVGDGQGPAIDQAPPSAGADSPVVPPEAGSREERILRDRARLWATASSQEQRGPEAEVLLCRLHDECYAIEPRLLRMVHGGTGLTPIPCTPAHVVGMLNVRGEVITVLDLATALGLASAPKVEAGSPILLAECAHVLVGLLVDEVLGVRRLALDALDRPLSGQDFVHGIADTRIVYLNLEHLLSSGRFDVSEEVH